jgi:acyl-CoA synthetase (AMP-forming)/AMP-acid ligase II
VLSAWQVPKDIWIVDEIPANERGKINRRELARQYAARQNANLRPSAVQ